MKTTHKITTCTHRGKLCLVTRINGRPRYRVLKNSANIDHEKVLWAAELMNGGAKQARQQTQKQQKLNKTLNQHLADYLAYLATECRSPRSQQVKLRSKQIPRILAAAKITQLDQLDASKIRTAIYSLRCLSRQKIDDKNQRPMLSAESRNHYIAGIKAFTNWLVEEEILDRDPLKKLKKPKVRQKRRARGYFTADELEKLIATAAGSGRPCESVTGYQRSILYLLAAYTGLRKSELASLTKESFLLDRMPPLVIAKPDDTKNGNEAKLPLNPLVVERVRAFLPSVTGKLFPALMVKKASKMVQLDLEEGGLPLVDSRGSTRDFHSLRHSFVTQLGRLTKDVRLVQKLARHADVSTTMGYMHTEDDELAVAVNLLGSSGRGS